METIIMGYIVCRVRCRNEGVRFGRSLDKGILGSLPQQSTRRKKIRPAVEV